MSNEQFNPIGMDASLDDIEDLPGFKAFPSGAYVIVLENGIESKQVNDKPVLEMAMKLEEIKEISEKDVDPKDMPAVGDICTTLFMLDNKFGAGKLKEVLKPIQEQFGTGKTIGEIVAVTKGLRLMVAIKRTFDEKKDKHYSNIVGLAIL